jgi:hypothetical protein
MILAPSQSLMSFLCSSCLITSASFLHQYFLPLSDICFTCRIPVHDCIITAKRIAESISRLLSDADVQRRGPTEFLHANLDYFYCLVTVFRMVRRITFI